MEHNVQALGFINCPCRDCKNLKQWQRMEDIRDHLLRGVSCQTILFGRNMGKKARTHLRNKLQRVYKMETEIQM
jgi:hypothetical protein